MALPCRKTVRRGKVPSQGGPFGLCLGAEGAAEHGGGSLSHVRRDVFGRDIRAGGAGKAAVPTGKKEGPPETGRPWDSAGIEAVTGVCPATLIRR